AVRFAREHHLKVHVQSTGHGATTPSTDGMLVVTSDLTELSVDPETRIATIGAGVRWAAVVEAGAPHGLAPISGSSGGVGVVGLVTGGGLGPLSRSHGFASDYVRGFTVVTGLGELVEATAEVNSDLFWALRGGKGGLGIVTQVRIELAAISELYAGALFFEEQHIEQAFRVWVDWTKDAASDVTTSAALFRVPPFDFIPEPLRGRTLLTLRFAYPGDAAVGEQLAAPLRAAAPVYLDQLGVLPVDKVALIHNDPTDPAPGWDRGALLTDIDQDFATALLAQAGAGAQLPMLLTEVRHLGDKTRTDVPGGSAVGGREGSFAFTVIGAPDASLFETVLPAAADRVFAAIAPWIAPQLNINFAGRLRSAEHFASAWPAETFARLATVRKKYDPDVVFPYGLAG
ncbi:MAG: FAD-binding protein, partial [Lacisediminihabitans sp.]